MSKELTELKQAEIEKTREEIKTIRSNRQIKQVYLIIVVSVIFFSVYIAAKALGTV